MGGNINNAIDNTSEENSLDNPRDIGADDISSLKSGEYVRVTAFAEAVSVAEGTLSIGDGEGLWSSAGLRLRVPYSDDNSYEVDAFSVDPRDFKEELKKHPPADFSDEPRTIGDTKYSACKATVVGKVSSINYTDEGHYLIGFSFGPDSYIEELEFIY